MSPEPEEGTVTEGTGNVFADLGLQEADRLLAKARLASAITETIGERGLTQAAAAELLGTSQPKVSNLVNGRLTGFSLERLTRFLNVLGLDVEIVVMPRSRPRRTGRITVTIGSGG